MNKSNLIFLDTETTGKGQEDRLCQVAYRFGDEEVESLFKPPVPIQIEAMAVTHITEKMVGDKETFIGSEMHKKLADIFSEEEVVLVAHNAQFDAEMLKKEGIEVRQSIDTLKIAHHLDPEAKIPKYALQYLRYFLDLNVEDVVPHSALGDVKVLEKLFERLFQKMVSECGGESEAIDEMIRISSRPILMKKFPFGKYIGKSVAEVASSDSGYLSWLLSQKKEAQKQGEGNDEDWIYTLEHYLKK